MRDVHINQHSAIALLMFRYHAVYTYCARVDQRRLAGAVQPVRQSDLSDDIFLEALDERHYLVLSDSGTLNFAKVAAACPRNTFQSLSLTFMPRWANSISLPLWLPKTPKAAKSLEFWDRPP